MYREEKASKGTLNVAGHDLIAIKTAKFLIYAEKSAWCSKTINYYQEKQYMKMLRTPCKLSAENLGISKTSNGSAGSCWFETQSPSLS